MANESTTDEQRDSVAVERLVRGRLYRGYRLVNHGYYPPDRCVWWQAENLKTGEADFSARTRRELKAEIDEYANKKAEAPSLSEVDPPAAGSATVAQNSRS
jgi:hypothetical protein